jgi:hypothetical protein
VWSGGINGDLRLCFLESECNEDQGVKAEQVTCKKGLLKNEGVTIVCTPE